MGLASGRRAMPQLAAPCGQEAESFSRESSATLPSSGAMRGKGGRWTWLLVPGRSDRASKVQPDV